jgi:hypothetical protein
MKINKKVKSQLKKYLMYSAIIMAIIITLFLFKINIGKMIIITIMILVGCICKIYKQFTSISIGFELITPITILFAYNIGIIFAIVSAIFMVIVSEFLSGKLNSHAISIEIIIYMIISIIAGILNSISIIPLAITLIVFRNITLWIIMVLMGFVDVFRATMATLPNFFINSFIINSLGVFFVNLL